MSPSERPWTFKEWVLCFQGVDLPIGDLAEAVAQDPDFPATDDYEAICAHIQSRSFFDRAGLEAFMQVWPYYQDTR